MNRRKWTFHILQLTGLLLLLAWPSIARAKFIIEFTDGRRMTVSNYEQGEETIKVYTTVGSFAFRKGDVAKITDISPKKEVRNYAGSSEQAVRSPKNVKAQSAQALEALAGGGSSEAKASRPVQAQAQIQKTLNTVSETPEGRTILWSLEYGIYRLRYVFALLVGIKVLKLFLAASAK